MGWWKERSIGRINEAGLKDVVTELQGMGFKIEVVIDRGSLVELSAKTEGEERGSKTDEAQIRFDEVLITFDEEEEFEGRKLSFWGYDVNAGRFYFIPTAEEAVEELNRIPGLQASVHEEGWLWIRQADGAGMGRTGVMVNIASGQYELGAMGQTI